MGCGKTTVGQLLARHLFYQFVDMDDWIVRKEGRSVPELFSLYGESGFRDLERRAVVEIAPQHGLVIATGGGTLLYNNNHERIKQNGTIILLQADFDVCWERIRDSDRPIVRAKTREELLELYDQRLAVYRKISDYEVFNNNSPRDAVLAILSTLARHSVRP